MPQATDLAIANAAAVSKTFVLMAPSAGFGGVAEWALKEGLVSTVFPRITASAVKQPSQANKVSIKFKIPSSYVDAASGLTKASTAFECNVTAVVPDAFPEALRADAIAYVKNGIATALLQAMIKDGLPAT